MIILHGGPADGAYAVTRAPLFLRALVSPSGKTDVLDQLDDEPRPRERVSVYRRTTTPDQIGVVFICGRSRSASGPSVSAAYEHLPDVDGQAVRETAAWRSWVSQRHEVAEYGAVMPEMPDGEVILTANCTYNHHQFCKGPVCDCKCHVTPYNPLP